MSAPTPAPPLSLDTILDALADRLAAKASTSQTSTRRLVDVRGAAEYLGCSPAAIRQKVARRELPTVRLDGKNRFDLRDLDALIEQAKHHDSR
jgi:excisionase family DNA binding protein